MRDRTYLNIMARKKYNKKVKRNLINSYLAKLGAPPSKSKEERGLFSKIKGFVKKYAHILTIVGVLSSLITIYQFWTSPEDKVRNKIESHVCVIREFHLADIKDTSNQDADMIKDFQLAAISFVNYWKVVEAVKPIEISKAFEDADPNIRHMYLERKRESQINKYKMLYYRFHEVKNKIDSIIIYGQKHGIYEYVYSTDRWNNMNKDFDIVERIVKDAKEQVKERWKIIESKRGSLDNLPVEDYSYAMEPYYEMFGTMEALKTMEDFMSFIIDFNASSMNHLKVHPDGT